MRENLLCNIWSYIVLQQIISEIKERGELLVQLATFCSFKTEQLADRILILIFLNSSSINIIFIQRMFMYIYLFRGDESRSQSAQPGLFSSYESLFESYSMFNIKIYHDIPAGIIIYIIIYAWIEIWSKWYIRS